jgi:hypothetical protein
MTALDKLVSSDLAALGVDSRRQRQSASVVLRAVSAAPRAREGEVMTARLARVFARRMACVVTGQIALMCALLLGVGLYVAGWQGADGHILLWSDLMHRDTLSFAVWLSAVLLASYLATRAIARRYFARQLAAVAALGAGDGDRASGVAVARGRELVAATGGWSIALSAGGIAALVAVIGKVSLVVGLGRWDLYGRSAPELRIAPIAGVAAAALLVVLGGALWQRRRDRRALARYGGVVVPSRASELVTLAGVFEARGARIIGGAVAVLCAGGLLFALHHPVGVKRIIGSVAGDPGMFGRLGGQLRQLVDRLPVPALLVVVVLTAYVLGGRLATWWFERELRGSRNDDACADARQLARRLDATSIALAIAGAAVLAAVHGSIAMTVGDRFASFFADHGLRVAYLLRSTLIDATAGFGVSLVAALVLARACARESAHRPSWIRVLERRDSLIAGLVMAAAIGSVGLWLDFEVDILGPAGVPPRRAHAAVSMLWTLAVLWSVASYMLRRRRRELAGIDPG